MLAKLQRLGLCLALCGLSACEVWLDVDAPQCKTNNDCVGLFGRDYTCGGSGVCVAPQAADGGTNKPDLPARWACANDMKGDFIDDPDKTVTIRMDAVDLNTLKVPEDIKAVACSPTDWDCGDPVLKDVMPGADGFFSFDLPYGFEGIIKFTAPNIVDSISKTNRPYLESVTTSGPAVLTLDARDDLANHAGHPIEPGTGVAILEIRDCADNAGDGINFDNLVQDDGVEETPFYFDGALPSRTLTATTISNLLGAGREPRAVAGFSNLKPGFPSFTARLDSNKAEIAKIVVPIFEDTTTYVRVYAGY